MISKVCQKLYKMRPQKSCHEWRKGRAGSTLELSWFPRLIGYSRGSTERSDKLNNYFFTRICSKRPIFPPQSRKEHCGPTFSNWLCLDQTNEVINWYLEGSTCGWTDSFDFVDHQTIWLSEFDNHDQLQWDHHYPWWGLMG